MCEFCTKHGNGKKWYLQAKNYGEDLAADVNRRRIAAKVFRSFETDEMARDVERLETQFPKLPATVRRIFGALFTRRHKKEHFGQVVPIEDIEKVLDITNSIVRVPCVCRQATLGREVAYCLGVSTGPIDIPDASYQFGPDTTGIDKLTKEEALEFMRGLEKQGTMHSVWTFGTPFIAGVCNCDRSDCVAMRSTIKHDIKVMFKAEYVAEVNRDLCNGCRSCLRLCQFGAMGYSAADKKAYIDTLKCYGCGVCRAGCSTGAVTLVDRTSVPLVARNW